MTTRIVVLDTETTGLDTKEGHRIIEVAAIEIINRRFSERKFHHYINPKRSIDKGAQAVHGINSSFLEDKPEFFAIIPEFIEFIRDSELVIHNADFDLGFLNYEFQLAGEVTKKVEAYVHNVFDTLKFARKKHPGQKNNLDALCRRYFIDNSGRELHGALLDAKLLGEVYLAMTGGQISMFADSSGWEFEQPARNIQTRIKNVIKNLPAIKISAEDEQAHNEYLKKMKKISGKCLWDEA